MASAGLHTDKEDLPDPYTISGAEYRHDTVRPKTPDPAANVDMFKTGDIMDLHSPSVYNDLVSSPSGYTVDSTCSAYTTESGYTVDSSRGLIQHKEEGTASKDDIEISFDDGKDCGIHTCRPECIQPWANIKLFIFTMCTLSMLSGTLVAGYVNSVITTIEKRFEFGSKVSGLIAASVELGTLVSVIFVSYLGGRRHIPKWIGIGTMIQGLGALMFALPHIVAEKYTILSGVVSNVTKDNICNPDFSASSPECQVERQGSWAYAIILVLAQILVGSGGSPLYTLGTTYIDDHVSRDKAPAFIAFVYATGALGPMLGFALGALMLQFYVDAFSFDSEVLRLTPSDPRWVGAWWGGFLICGGMLLLAAIPFFAFPKVLHKAKAKLEDEKQNVKLPAVLDKEEEERIKNYGKNIRDMPASMWRLLGNPVYFVTTLGICFEVCIVSGFIVFLPKYLETQFGISKSQANLLTGCIAIPGACMGILIGGFVLKKFQLAAKGALQVTLALNMLAMCGFSLIFLTGCNNVKMAGATLPYFNSTGHEILVANLTSDCNLDCECNLNQLEPVCGINGLTYFSPCHAGCTRLAGTYQYSQNYSDCACILSNMNLVDAEVIASPLATSGPCQHPCHSLSSFMMLLFLITFVVAGTQMPLVMVTLRSVGEEERAFALGMQFVLLRLFAYIPAPIIYGTTIDSTCLVWKEHCGNHGSCLFYDIEYFRYKYIGVSSGLKLMAAVFFITDWFLICRSDNKDLKKTLQVGDIVRSVTSIASLDSNGEPRLRGHRRTSSNTSRATIQPTFLGHKRTWSNTSQPIVLTQPHHRRTASQPVHPQPIQPVLTHRRTNSTNSPVRFQPMSTSQLTNQPTSTGKLLPQPAIQQRRPSSIQVDHPEETTKLFQNPAYESNV